MRWLRRKAGISTEGDVDSAIQQAGQGNVAIQFFNPSPDQVAQVLKAIESGQDKMVVVASSPRPGTAGFLGRDKEVRELVEMIRTRRHNVIGICDQAGNGKSTLVARVLQVLANLEEFPRASWVPLRPGVTFDDITGRLLAETGAADVPPDPNERIARVIESLQQPRLLIFDAFEYVLDEDGRCGDPNLGELLRALSGSQHQAQVLLTSRRRPVDVEPGLGAYCPYPSDGALGGLDTNFGVELLGQEKVTGNEELVQEAAAQLKGNPKALLLLAGYLRRHHGGDASVLAGRPGLISHGVSGLVDEIAGSLNEEERTLAQRVAVLRRPVPDEALVALADQPPEEAQAAITGLREQSVLDRSHEDGLWSLHSLVRDRWADQPDREGHGLAASYYAGIEPPAGLAPKTLEDVFMLVESFHHFLCAGDSNGAEGLIRQDRFGASIDEDLTAFLTRRGFAKTAVDLEEQLAAVIPESQPEAWAGAQVNLARAYGDLPTGDRGDNLQRAIGGCQAALGVYTEENYPAEWATTQNNLGAAYAELPTGDRADNLQRAVAAYEAALRVWTEEHYPRDRAAAQNNLGAAYAELPTGDRADNLQRAIAAYQAALRFYTEQNNPAGWARVQSNLGTAYSELPTGDGAHNLQRAIAAYQAALRVRTEEDYPQDWATTQNNLGAAYSELPTGDRADNLHRAIDAYLAALRVRTEEDYPREWAATQNNLGAAYGRLPTGDRADNLQRAIAAYQAALRVYTEDNYPREWAATQNNLGAAYSELSTGDRGDNLQSSIAACQAALHVYTEEDYPREWAMIQNNLGLVYRNLPTGDRADNLQRAIAAYQAALRVRTEEDYPDYWSSTQSNLRQAEEALERLEEDR